MKEPIYRIKDGGGDVTVVDEAGEVVARFPKSRAELARQFINSSKTLYVLDRVLDGVEGILSEHGEEEARQWWQPGVLDRARRLTGTL